MQVTIGGGSGRNLFSLRGVTSGNAAGPVTISGTNYMGLIANIDANQTAKYAVVRVPSTDHGQTLRLNFFDIGDANSAGTITIAPPADSNVGSAFADSVCTWTGNSTSGAAGFALNTAAAPWGPFTGITGCTIPGVSAAGTWNAQWSTVKVAIPPNYTCNDSDPAGCWITINYLFAGAVRDATSWTATLNGG